jgi:hypothetical protein
MASAGRKAIGEFNRSLRVSGLSKEEIVHIDSQVNISAWLRSLIQADMLAKSLEVGHSDRIAAIEAEIDRIHKRIDNLEF